MGEGMGFDWLSGLMGGGGGVGGMMGQVPAGYQFGDMTNGAMATGQPFGGQASGYDFMGGSLGANAQNQPLSFGMDGYGQGGMGMNMAGLAGIGKGMGQQQQHAPQQMAMMGGGGGNTKNLFRSLMRQPNLTHQAMATPSILGGNLLG